MSDSPTDLKLVERQLRRLVSAIIEKAESDSNFAAQLAKILNSPKSSDRNEPEKATKIAFNAVEILHREGREALQRQLEFRTDTELKDILRQGGVRQQKDKKQLDRNEAILSIINQAERLLHQGASFYRPEASQPDKTGADS